MTESAAICQWLCSAAIYPACRWCSIFARGAELSASLPSPGSFFNENMLRSAALLFLVLY